MLSAILILSAVAALDAAPLAAKTVSSAGLDANKDVLNTTPSIATTPLSVTKETKIKKVDPKDVLSAMKDFPAKKVSVPPAKTASTVITVEAPTATPAAEEATKTSVLLPDPLEPELLPEESEEPELLPEQPEEPEEPELLPEEPEDPEEPDEAIPEPSAVIGWPSEALKARLESPFVKPLFEDHKAQSFVHSALSGYTYFF